MNMRSASPLFLLAVFPALITGQTPNTGQKIIPKVAISSFATTEVRFNGRYSEGQWSTSLAGIEGPSRFTISYGQPHARGRQILGDIVPMDLVWRLGANAATRLTTDVDLMIGGKRIPHGAYTLWALPTASGWTLIVNKEVGQFGAELDYNESADFVRIPIKSRKLETRVESLSIFLIPNPQRGTAESSYPTGVLRIVWADFELTADWSLADWKAP
jgi:hypothetical protein